MKRAIPTMSDGEAGTEVSEIISLDPPVRFTDIFLWDDVGLITSGVSTHNDFSSLELDASSLFHERQLNSFIPADEESSTQTIASLVDYRSAEEMELAQQMGALGLPLSFGTSKARSNETSRSKRKGAKPKSASHEKEINNPVPQAMLFSQMENPTSSSSLHDSANMPSCLYVMKDMVDALYHDANSRGDLHFDESPSIPALDSRNETREKPDWDEMSDANTRDLTKFELSPDTVGLECNAEVLGSLSFHVDSCFEEIFEDACSGAQFHHDEDLSNVPDLDRCSDNSFTSHSNMYPKGDKGDTTTLQRCSVSADSPLFPPLDGLHDNFIYCESGDWMIIWDRFYKSNYFYNVQTQESTWYAPPGLEKYAFSCSNLSRKETHVVTAEKNAGSERACGSISNVVNSLPENVGGFHFTDEQSKISAKMETEIDIASPYTIAACGNSHLQLLACPSYATDGMKGCTLESASTSKSTTILIHSSAQADDENQCKDLDEQKEKQQSGMLGSYYGHDCSMPTISEDGNVFSFPETDTSSSVGLDISCETVVINKKLRVRKPQSQKMQDLAWCLSSNLLKYWCQRYSLFSRFDNGIQMDEESWFSVTPELIAKHHAFRCGGGTIIDCFSGVGGNAIQFAMRSNHVIAIDVDPQKIDYAHHNAVIYEVSERIDFIKGDFFKVAPSLKAEVVYLSPPWGGPDYVKMQTYDIRFLKPRDGYHLFKIASMIAAKVVMFLPRNVNLDQLVDLSLSVDRPWNLEIEKNYLNGKLKSITAYFDQTCT